MTQPKSVVASADMSLNLEVPAHVDLHQCGDLDAFWGNGEVQATAQFHSRVWRVVEEQIGILSEQQLEHFGRLGENWKLKRALIYGLEELRQRIAATGLGSDLLERVGAARRNICDASAVRGSESLKSK